MLGSVAKELGKLQDDSETAKDRFWEQEKQAVYAAWQKNFKAASRVDGNPN
jgi:hypothetical protein